MYSPKWKLDKVSDPNYYGKKITAVTIHFPYAILSISVNFSDSF